MPLELAAKHGRPVAARETGQAPLAVSGLTVTYGAKPALFSLSAEFHPGAMTGIIGPNGAGKSTLLKAVLGIVKPVSGQIRAFSRPARSQLRRIAYVPQRASVDWDFPARVLDVVLMGLSRELGLLRPIRQHHRESAMECLARVGMEQFSERQIGQLSGGQQQRVFLARALAQRAELYMLDEPFAGVDAATEKAIIAVLQSLRDAGKTVIAVHHDLSTVTAYFDRVLMINTTRIAEGPVSDAFTPETLQATYGGRLAPGQIAQIAG